MNIFNKFYTQCYKLIKISETSIIQDRINTVNCKHK